MEIEINLRPKLNLFMGRSLYCLYNNNLKRGATEVLESTVYPGVTEEIVKHVLERESKMKCTD